MELNQEIWGERRRLKLTSKFMRLSLTWKPTEKESLSVQYSQLRFFEPYVVMLLLKKWFKKPTKNFLGYWGEHENYLNCAEKRLLEPKKFTLTL